MIGELPQLKRNSFAGSESINEYMLRRVRMKKGLLRAISPDTNIKTDGVKTTSLNRLPITSKTISKLGVEVLFDRRLCLAGQMLQGIKMPKHHSLQVLIMKGFLKWYSTCIQLGESSYDVDKKCFKEREKRFLKLLMKSRRFLWRFVMSSNRPHFYFH